MPTYRDYNCDEYERRVQRRIEGLSDDSMHLFPSIRRGWINDTDLLLVDMEAGAFVIEIKCNRLHKIRHYNVSQMEIETDEGIKSDRSATAQALTCQRQIVEYLKRYDKPFPFMVAVVLWENISRADWLNKFPDEELAENMLFQDDVKLDLDVFRHRLSDIYRARVEKFNQRQRVREIELQTIVTSFQNNQKTPRSPSDIEKLRKFEHECERASFEAIPNNAMGKIVFKGVPGTGKTWKMLAAARRYAEQGKHVLFLCYNLVLRADIQRMMEAWNRPEVTNYITVNAIYDHLAFMNEQAGCNIVLEGQDYPKFGQDVCDAIRKKNIDWLKYDLMLIDESQDMVEHIQMIIDECTSTSTVLVASIGVGQELYTDAPPTWLTRFEADATLVACSKIYRTTAQTFVAAQILNESDVRGGVLTADIVRIANGRCTGVTDKVEMMREAGTCPLLEYTSGDDSDHDQMHQLVTAALERLDVNDCASDILFLVPSKRCLAYQNLVKYLSDTAIPYIDLLDEDNRLRTPKINQVRISTYFSSRGVEAHYVYLMGLDYMQENIGRQRNRDTCRQQLYIGITRAVRQAYIVATTPITGTLTKLMLDVAKEMRSLTPH
jgi:DNA replication protein DnaC